MLIVKYDVIEASNLDTFKRLINSRLTDGWQPLGDLVVEIRKSKTTWYLQSITLKEKKPNVLSTR